MRRKCKLYCITAVPYRIAQGSVLNATLYAILKMQAFLQTIVINCRELIVFSDIKNHMHIYNLGQE